VPVGARLGYTRTGAVALGVLLLAGTVSAYVWRDLLVFGDPDWLLMGVWAVMALLMAAHVDVSHDVPLAAVALAGGAFIETWGTRSGLWTYFTHQKPPPFILLAWPPAALATDRLARAVTWAADRLDAAAPDPDGQRWRWVWWSAMGGFVVLLAAWTRPGWGHPLTWAAGGAVGLVLWTVRDHRRDACRFAAGAALGYLLERWGTTRECWTYWSGGTPPLTSVLAHGFATVAFLRVADVVSHVWRRLLRRAAAPRSAIREAQAL
jgi:hypothetical protein